MPRRRDQAGEAHKKKKKKNIRKNRKEGEVKDDGGLTGEMIPQPSNHTAKEDNKSAHSSDDAQTKIKEKDDEKNGKQAKEQTAKQSMERAEETILLEGLNTGSLISSSDSSLGHKSSMDCSKVEEFIPSEEAKMYEAVENGSQDTEMTELNSFREGVLVEGIDEPNKNSPSSLTLHPSGNGNEEEQQMEWEPVTTNVEEVKTTMITTTIYLAAPTGCRLAFTGEDVDWRNPQASFEAVKDINPDTGIFRGTVPVPFRLGSPFKFVLVDPNGTIKYEDDRNDELLPDSTYFFVVKSVRDAHSQIALQNATEGEEKVVQRNQPKEMHQKILVEFLHIAFDVAIGKVSLNWDSTLDVLSDYLQKLRSLQSDEAQFRGSFSKFVDGRLQFSELQLNYDHIVLLVAGAYLTNCTFTKTFKGILMKNAASFSRYLSELLPNVQQNQGLVFKLMETLIGQGGADFYWIPFHFKQECSTLKDVPLKEVCNALINTMQVSPELLLEKETIASQVTRFLLKCGDLDDIYDRLRPLFVKTPRYKTLMDGLLLIALMDHEKNLPVDSLIQLLCSGYLKELCEQESRDNDSPSSNKQDALKTFFSSLFKWKSFTEIIQLACSTPNYLMKFVIPFVELSFKKKIESLSYEDYKYFADSEPTLIAKFPEIHKNIVSTFLRMLSKDLDTGSFENIRNVDLVLRGLAKRLDTIPFLERSSLISLQKSIHAMPRHFFKNLHICVKGKILKARRKGATEDVVEAVERHIKLVDEIVVSVKSQLILLKDVANLLDPQVVDYLKHAGLEERVLKDLRQQVEELKKRYELYSGVYKKLARLNLIQTSSSSNVTEGALKDEEKMSKPLESFQVLNAKEWERYLKDIDFDQSIVTLQNAMSLPMPANHLEAVWLNKVKDCSLFMEKIWYPSVETVPNTPLVKGTLSKFIQDCSVHWSLLAQGIADGTTPLEEMKKLILLQPDPSILAQSHLNQEFPVQLVKESYRDFNVLQNLQHSIGPFVVALRAFKITKREEIDTLYVFINDNLIKNWSQFTLKQVRESGFFEKIKTVLNIDPEKPELTRSMELIGSLVTEPDGSAPLVQWLRKKKIQDMEAMGKVLQGSLLEAYGQLQTLRTRIAPFFDQQFETYHHFLSAVQKTEQRFAGSVAGRVQPIKCKWLANLLSEIDAAIRASVTSPSADAKEKLMNLSHVIIDVKDEDCYQIEVRLKPNGSLSMEELKQAFQLLDLSTTDDNDASITTRRCVGLILRLAQVFSDLFDSGCITSSLMLRKVITIEKLEEEIQNMKDLLDIWKDLWKQIDDMPHLALFSRSYMLRLADLIRKQETQQVCSILQILLPSASDKLEVSVGQLIQLVNERSQSDVDEYGSVSTEQLLHILRELHKLIQLVYYEKSVELNLPAFLTSFGRSLRSHFIEKSVEILNVPRHLMAGSALAAYISFTGRRLEPSRILFVTANTTDDEVKRFMTLWSIPHDATEELFIIAHIERLSASAAVAVRDAVGTVLPERRTKLLLLAQQDHLVQSTRSLGVRLGLVCDRLLHIDFTVNQLSKCLSKLLPKTAQMYFFTSKLPGCGKSQQAMRLAGNGNPRPNYFRIPIRFGTMEELLDGLRKIDKLSRESDAFLHLDVARSTSLEFNDLLLSLLIRGALFNPNKAKLGFWSVSNLTTIAVEFASPFGTEEFPIIDYLGRHTICECTEKTFSYDLAVMPRFIGQEIVLNQSNALVAVGKFLKLKEAGITGLTQWDAFCTQPETIMTEPLPAGQTFRHLVNAFQVKESREVPTFSALSAMASFIHRHITAMMNSMWFNESAIFLFDDNEQLSGLFKLNVFELLLRVANDCVARSWSILGKGSKLAEMDWTLRQRAMFLLGLDENGQVMGVNIVGRNTEALKAMFHSSLLPILERQRLHFQELRGFKNLLESTEGEEIIINAMRSLLLLDGADISIAKVRQLDDHPLSTPTTTRLRRLIGKDLGYVLTGDNITKMMFALYRIRCGLPVIAFGEAGVGKSALFRFLIESLLGHEFRVCNVNSGTTIIDVAAIVGDALRQLANKPQSEIFLFFDEMNTADPPVIAFLKELMLDRHCDGMVLPEKLHIMAAANPYRSLKESDKEAAVGLAFRFVQSAKNDSNPFPADNRNLVYRVNELPRSFYDHLYDFGYLCEEAENTYIEEICHHWLPKSNDNFIQYFINILRESHRVARAMSRDRDSAVSLRDTTRAVQLFRWFCKSPPGKKLANGPQVAMDLSIYLVYAFRFTERATFLKRVFGETQSASRNMTKVSRQITKTFHRHAHSASIGAGAIALNDALCENLFALYVCVLNGIFLIIVGRPGSSKSLSVEILKLVLSPDNYELRRELGDLPALTERYFQCSPLSTSSGFKALFDSAQKLSNDPKTMLAMVVLDELGLADLSPEKPIKVLHSELEHQAVLTSGEKNQSPYSVVALSNWVVDAAQVNRGILISRTKAEREDLLQSSMQLAESLVSEYVDDDILSKRIHGMLREFMKCIVDTYQVLDSNTDVGGGHFFSMRDFFFCVKNFVCSILPTSEHGQMDIKNFNISDHHLIQSTIRNFGGHEKAQKVVRECMAKCLKREVASIPPSLPLDLIVQNINDSSKKLSVHIARHLMILNRSLIGLPLLNRHVKHRLDSGLGWNVLFGSCFPGDLQVMAVTRKLRQVEQAIRSGGVLILCHADQLFESLYMVLNQQYWAQGENKMTQIALGPATRAITLPDGPFRIIALQDTDAALNRNTMSPAVLSRFEKHELKPSHLLDQTGRFWLNYIDSHPMWMAVPEIIKRKQLLHGYHEESFATLALHFQEIGQPMEIVGDNLHAHWLRAVNPMAMIKLERKSRNNEQLQTFFCLYRKNYILEGIDDALDKLPSSRRMVIMTNTLCHLEISSHHAQSFVIRLFDIQTELQLHEMLDSVQEENRNNADYCIFIQYDATTGPIEQFQMTKYEVETRMDGADCRIVFIVHVDPRSTNMRWVYSFGDGWDYAFVDELEPVDQSFSSGHQRLSLSELVNSPVDCSMADFISSMTEEEFKSLLFELLGPILQTCLFHLGSSLGRFFTAIRGALGLPGSERLVKILKECLVAQMVYNSFTWNVVEVVSDPDFDSSSSLTDGLWGAYKKKVSIPVAHLLLTSDVWKVSDSATLSLWCDFVEAHYPDRLMLLNSSDAVIQIPFGFHFCSQPFGRLLVSFDLVSTSVNQSPNVNGLLPWLFDNIARSNDVVTLKKAYFRDWFMLHVPPHLRSCLELLPMESMLNLIDVFFGDQETFFGSWKCFEADVVAALELVSIAAFALSERFPWNIFVNIRSWKKFSKVAAVLSVTALADPAVIENRNKWMQSISSIETSTALSDLLDCFEDTSKLWLGLRITKRMLLFDPNCRVKLPDLLGSSVEILFQNMTELIIDSLILPRLPVDGERGVHLEDLTTATVDSLLSKDRQKFLFFFQRIAELFVHHRRNHPYDIHEFLSHLLDERTYIRVSWRFLTVVMKTILSNQSGRAMVDTLLSTIRCNASTVELNSNTQNFLLALLALQDRAVCSADVGNDDRQLQPARNWKHAIMKNGWTVERIRQLALIRKALTSGDARIDVAIEALTEWSKLRRKRRDQEATESFLFFILNFSSDQGDEMRLGNILSRLEDSNDIKSHAIVGPFIQILSPISLGFDLKPVGRSQRFEERLMSGLPFDDFLQHYPLLLEFNPEWAPYIARLALHAADVVESKGIRLLRELARNPDVATQCFLPGIDNHPHLASFMAEGFVGNGRESRRWYICSCGTANCVGHCGNPTRESICINCRIPLAEIVHEPRPGVRRATIDDFQPLRGLATSRIPSTTPTFTVRNKPAVVTRFCLLLSSLVLMKAAMDHRTSNEAIIQLLRTLERNNEEPNDELGIISWISFFFEHIRHGIVWLLCTLSLMNRENPGQHLGDRRSLIGFLSNQIQVHLRLLNQLLVTERPLLNQSDQFRIGHLLLHQLLHFQHASLHADARQFTAGPQPRDNFENALAQLLSRQNHLECELDQVTEQSNLSSTAFRRALAENRTSHWSYACLASSNRDDVQLILARDENLRQRYPFLDLLLDEDWSNKLDALQNLRSAVRFIALVRTILQGNITLEEANRMTIGRGLEKIAELVEQKAVLLDRGRVVSSRDHVDELFKSFKSLWDRFSQIPNLEQKTFLDYFECQQVNLNIRPRTILDENAPLILILAGNDSNIPETTFACQLLSHAVETAAFIAQMPFVQPGCRPDSNRAQLLFSNAAALADFEDSLFVHVSIEEVNAFITDHAIDIDTIELAESFAMAVVLGPAGNTIAQNLTLEIVGEFYFKDNVDSNHFLSSLERRSSALQPTALPPGVQERIIVELEYNQRLAEAKDVLASTIIHVLSNTEPLFISKMRLSFISDILEDLERAGILTQRHLSATTMTILKKHIQLEVRHAFGLLKGIISRMRGDDIFRGRIPAGWDTMLDDRTAQDTMEKMRSQGSDIRDSLLHMANIISSSEEVPEWLSPDKSLLTAIHLIELDDNWNGIQRELKMEHLGHVLILAENL